jgi:hypothetical protein
MRVPRPRLANSASYRTSRARNATAPPMAGTLLDCHRGGQRPMNALAGRVLVPLDGSEPAEPILPLLEAQAAVPGCPAV